MFRPSQLYHRIPSILVLALPPNVPIASISVIFSQIFRLLSLLFFNLSVIVLSTISFVFSVSLYFFLICVFVFLISSATTPISPVLSEISLPSTPLNCPADPSSVFRSSTSHPPPSSSSHPPRASSTTFVVPSSSCDIPMDVGPSPSRVSLVDATTLSLAHGLLTSLPGSSSLVSVATTPSSYRHSNVFSHISPRLSPSPSGSHTSSTLPYATPSLDELPPLRIDLSPISPSSCVDNTPFRHYPLATSPTSSTFPPLPSSTSLLPPCPPPISPDVDVLSIHADDASFILSPR